jgi:hypothetical protein
VSAVPNHPHRFVVGGGTAIIAIRGDTDAEATAFIEICRSHGVKVKCIDARDARA